MGSTLLGAVVPKGATSPLWNIGNTYHVSSLLWCAATKTTKLRQVGVLIAAMMTNKIIPQLLADDIIGQHGPAAQQEVDSRIRIAVSANDFMEAKRLALIAQIIDERLSRRPTPFFDGD